MDGLKILTAMIPKSKEEAAEDELRRLSADGKWKLESFSEFVGTHMTRNQVQDRLGNLGALTQAIDLLQSSEEQG